MTSPSIEVPRASCVFVSATLTLETSIKFSSTYQLSMDCRIEWVNQILQWYLRYVITYLQDDWIESLLLSKYAKNNTILLSISTSPFFAIYRFHSWFNVNNPSSSIHPSKQECPQLLKLWVHHDVGVKLSYVQDKYKNKVEHRWTPPPKFKFKNKTWLLCHNIITTRPYNKILGPFLAKQT